MLGLGDWQIVSALVGCVGITAFAVVYGALNWNSGSDARKEVAEMRRRRRSRNKRGGKL